MKLLQIIFVLPLACTAFAYGYEHTCKLETCTCMLEFLLSKDVIHACILFTVVLQMIVGVRHF